MGEAEQVEVGVHSEGLAAVGYFDPSPRGGVEGEGGKRLGGAAAVLEVEDEPGDAVAGG